MKSSLLRFHVENQTKARYETIAIINKNILDFSLILQFTKNAVINNMIASTNIMLLLQKLGTKTNHHKNVHIIAHIVQIADILPAVFHAVFKFSNFNFKIIGFTVPIQNDGRKNIRTVLRIAHIFILEIVPAILVNINF
jgi:hypothetical protein